MQQLTLTRPDDWHLHLRDGGALKAVLPHTVRQESPRDRDAQFETSSAIAQCSVGNRWIFGFFWA